VIERIGQPHGRRGLAFTGRRRRDCGNEDQLAVGFVLERLDVVHRNLGLVVAIGVEVLCGNAELLAGDVEDRPLHRGLRDFDI
jgi:hypothetical protein